MVSWNPIINYSEITLGDLLAIIAVLTTCCLPIMWCYFQHRYREQLQIQSKIQSKSYIQKQMGINNEAIDQSIEIEFEPFQYFYDLDKEAVIETDVDDIEQDDIEQDDIEQDDIERNAILQKENSSFRRKSISGPSRGSAHFTIFVIALITMIIAGSSNDFLGKLIYQVYPGNIDNLNGLSALKHEYWLTFLLTAGSFFVCTFAICSKSARTSFPKMNRKLFMKIVVPSMMDTVVTGGRYLGLVFLPAALISILKNGSQLLFLALIRRCFHHKKLLCAEWLGIATIIAGLLVVAMNKMYATITDVDSLLTPMDAAVGLSIMIGVGFAGAIRNDMEELLLKDDDLDSNFVVGLESAISLTFTMILGIILLLIDPFNNIDEDNAWDHIVRDVITNPALILCLLLFLIAIYAKDTMQMKMTLLSSSLTRKLFQQMYPSCTWFISLAAYAIHCIFFETEEYASDKRTYDASHGHEYGESWEGKYSWIRLGGFIVVAIGNCLYIKGHFIFQKLKGSK